MCWPAVGVLGAFVETRGAPSRRSAELNTSLRKLGRSSATLDSSSFRLEGPVKPCLCTCRSASPATRAGRQSRHRSHGETQPVTSLALVAAIVKKQCNSTAFIQFMDGVMWLSRPEAEGAFGSVGARGCRISG